jgi:hypothetical protein
MGEVWLAHDPTLERDVAIKVLPTALADDAERLQRFLREARAAAQLDHPNTAFLTEDRPVVLLLKDRCQDRKSEVRSLAARCLAYLESYHAVIAELADEKQRAHWAADFDVLRQSVSRRSESAVRVRVTLESLCGEDGAKLYRLLWSYSPQQLQEGGAEELVALLDRDSLPLRVLAYENLRRITQKTNSYRPEASRSQRKSSLGLWQSLLQKGGIAYATSPSPTSTEE